MIDVAIIFDNGNVRRVNLDEPDNGKPVAVMITTLEKHISTEVHNVVDDVKQVLVTDDYDKYADSMEIIEGKI